MATRSSRRRVWHHLMVVTVGLLALTLIGSSASAYWTGGGVSVGAGSASTGRLDPPTAVSATSTPGSGSVAVSWAAPAGGVTPDGYYVQRTRTSTGATTLACGSSSTTLVHSSCTDTAVPDGTYTYKVTAVAGSWTAAGAPSASVAVSSTAGTTTTLTSSANPSVAGQTVTYTATVTSGSGGTPSGQVAFNDGGQPVTCTGGTQQLNPSGTATCQVAYTAVGSHLMTAVYGGAPGVTGSTSAVLTQTVNRAQTSTTLGSSANPAVTGQTVTYTATVSVTGPGSGSPTGSVAFKAGAASITGCGAQPVNASGVATCATTYPTTGVRAVTATFSGDTAFAGSASGGLTQTVGKASTTISVGSPKNPQKSGQQVTFTATLSVVSPGAGTPTGTVVFKDGGSTISGCSAQPLTAGQATCAVTYSAMSTHQITAEYAGDGNYLGSVSSQLTQRVVNVAVTGILLTGVTVSGSPVTPTCTGAGTGNATCTVAGGNNAVAVANVVFVNASGVATTYSLDATTVSTSVTGKNPGSSQLHIAGNATTSSDTATVAQNGKNSGTITATFGDGISSFTVTLTVG